MKIQDKLVLSREKTKVQKNDINIREIAKAKLVMKTLYDINIERNYNKLVK